MIRSSDLTRFPSSVKQEAVAAIAEAVARRAVIPASGKARPLVSLPRRLS